MEKATLGGGCFWCIEAVFADLEGVRTAISGYTGGRKSNPTYQEVCSGTSGHVEVVQVEFDSEKVSFAEILRVFFYVHDPTTLNRQGNDIGSQYRSVIFFENEAQRTVAETIVAEVQAYWDEPIVTKIEAATPFFKAEDYHQDYFKLHGREPYCQFVVAPKVAKFRKAYADRLKQ